MKNIYYDIDEQKYYHCFVIIICYHNCYYIKREN